MKQKRYPEWMMYASFFMLFAKPLVLSAAPADSISVELMASQVSSISAEFTGHAFMCIALQLNSGIKEDCYGFYPKNDNLQGYIGGPGVVESEFKKKPNRFSRVDQSLKVTINPEQRRAILTLVNDWDSANYALSTKQCVDFIRAVAQAAGLKVPTRIVSEFPAEFLTRLKHLNL